ncbi:hypothetical protein BCV70DRAFT_155730 [Testicularia cyperi]|uniref:ferric-chelate reductase (NADPH) n=1 Tax=Testicularia cyperi TaxID=1882483 RepID=A0A317XXM1_9BASI|nr:hypothetical protein BCV70DRAFT_155730 [Testicularia cyperi]
MDSPLFKRHKETPGCVWAPGMVGPGCRPPSAVKKAAMAGHDSYYTMGKYSRIVTWVFLALIGLAIARHLLARLRHSSRRGVATAILAAPGYGVVTGFCRGIGYYRPKRIFARRSLLGELVSADRFPSMGNILFIALPSIGFIAWCFSIKPYYRPSAVWGSTPLGVRSGMIANGMFPFLFCFGLKFNPLTWMTGISHEKLQIFHQWTARVILFFSVVHTVAFLWQPVHDGGFSNLKAWFYYDKIWWQGTVAFAFFAWLVMSSFGVFRRMSYEFFVLQHVISVILFLVFYFMHTRDLISSWSWLWPSIGVWGFHVLFKFANSLRISRFVGVTATITLIDEGDKLMKLETTAPVSWQPGQHFFLRFPSINRAAPYQSHPFTCTNLPSPLHNEDSHLIFYFKARDGLTQKIYDRLTSQLGEKVTASSNSAKFTIALDGPYGTPFHPASYHSSMLLAGGVGITAVLPSLMSLCRSVGSVSAPLTRKVNVTWCVPSLELFDALEPTLRPMLEHLNDLGIDASLDVYSTSASARGDLNNAETDSASEVSLKSPIRLHHQRAEIPEVITGFVRASSPLPSVGVSVCGPASMLNETANTVSRLQWTQVLSSRSDIKELYLHTEAFDW